MSYRIQCPKCKTFRDEVLDRHACFVHADEVAKALWRALNREYGTHGEMYPGAGMIETALAEAKRSQAVADADALRLKDARIEELEKALDAALVGGTCNKHRLLAQLNEVESKLLRANEDNRVLQGMVNKVRDAVE